jgi:dTDP-4-amino-4,6-dideoxygalactose transaminase
MDEICAIARRHGLYVVEDAAHAHGSEWKGRRTGSLGDAGSFSFQASKNLCAGEGGMITTNNRELYDMCWSIHHCGRSAYDTVWYSHPFIGTNARMTEWQAAILDAQMERLDEQIARREENAAYLTSLLRQLGFADPPPDDERITRTSYHLYLFTYRSERCAGLSRDAFCDALRAEGIPCSIGYRCLYEQGFFASEAMRRQTGSTINYAGLHLVNTELAVNRAIWFTQNMLLGERKDMDDIAEAMAKICDHADEISG